MKKYKFLIIVFLAAVLAMPFASLFNFNVQLLYRLPFINVRWVDIAIIAILFSYFLNLQFNKNLIQQNMLIKLLCFIFLFFETFQLIRSWGTYDLEAQISRYLCILTIFIVLDVATYKLNKNEIIDLLKYFAIMGSFTLLIKNIIFFYSFLSGHVIITDANIRVGLSAEGINEVVSTDGLEAFVYIFALYFTQNKSTPRDNVLFISAIISIFFSTVLRFSRGGLFTLVFLTLIYILVFSKDVKRAFISLFSILFLIVAFILVFSNILREKGYDPIAKVVQIATYAVDKDNPDWDKGRSLSRRIALDAWEKNPLIGVGYDDLSNHGLPMGWATAHSFVITSLFHRGIIGTSIYLLILLLLYRDGVRFWRSRKKETGYENDIIKLLIVVTFIWLIGFATQEVIWEKYSLSMQFFFLSLVSNYYRQQDVAADLTYTQQTSADYL
jgi:hypothetical protein